MMQLVDEVIGPAVELPAGDPEQAIPPPSQPRFSHIEDWALEFGDLDARVEALQNR